MPGIAKRQPPQKQTQPKMSGYVKVTDDINIPKREYYKTPLELANEHVSNEAVNSPSHYTATKIEAIEIIKLITENEKNGFVGGLITNIVKYIIRFRHKNGVQDLKKAKWYLERLILEIESETPK